MENLMKNIAYAAVLPLAEQITVRPGEVSSKTLTQNDAVSITLFAFDKGEEISTHRSEGDAFVYALDGLGHVVIDGESYALQAGETIVMPAGRPHSLYADAVFKMLLVVIFP